MDHVRGQSLIIKDFGGLPLGSNTHLHKSSNNFKLKDTMLKEKKRNIAQTNNQIIGMTLIIHKKK